jgi:preprotein translocase subunit SecG
MQQALSIIQIIISVVLIVLVLVQARGTGFGRTSGLGSGGTSFTRRGLEKLIFRLTFIFVALFLIVSIISLLV